MHSKKHVVNTHSVWIGNALVELWMPKVLTVMAKI
jgi:hypothetical protein